MDNENVMTVSINRKPSFTEIWHEGSVTYENKEHMFWLINPRGLDDQGREYEMEVRWWFKQVPMEVRKLSEQIINDFKDAKDDSTNSTRNSKSI